MYLCAMFPFIKYFPLLMLVHGLMNYVVEGVKQDPEASLIHDLLKNYTSPYVRPSSDPVVVRFRFAPTITILDESSQELLLRGMLAMIWADKRLTWNPKDYGGVDVTHIPLEEDNKLCIWKPELVLNESLDKDSNNFHTETNVAKLFHDGMIQWYTLAMTTSYCRVNVQHFPFDTQICELTFTTWLYQTTEQVFHVIDDIIHNEAYKKYEEPSGLWDFKISYPKVGNASYDCSTCGNETQSYIQYTLQLTRSNHVWYILNYLLPCIVLSIMTILILWLPHKEGVDASSFGLTCILTLFVFLTFLFTQLPATGPPGMGFYVVWLILEAVCATVYVTVTTPKSAGRDNINNSSNFNKKHTTENDNRNSSSEEGLLVSNEDRNDSNSTEEILSEDDKKWNWLIIKIKNAVAKAKSNKCKTTLISLNIGTSFVFCICLFTWD